MINIVYLNNSCNPLAHAWFSIYHSVRKGTVISTSHLFAEFQVTCMDRKFGEQIG